LGSRQARKKEMRNAYIIEIDDEAVGIAARDRGGFRFHAALQALNGLDGRLFRSLKEAARAARVVLGDRPAASDKNPRAA
jgi:N-acetyl-beta-hexosaminidase